MFKKHLLLPLFVSLFLSLTTISCKEKPEELNLDPETEALVNILQDELVPLDTDPLSWKDQDLWWLDPLASKSVIGRENPLLHNYYSSR